MKSSRAAAAPTRNQQLLRRHEREMQQQIEAGMKLAARRVAARIARELGLPREG